VASWGHSGNQRAAAVVELIEQGEDDEQGRGRWYKYSDGRMVCERDMQIEGVDVNVAMGPWYRSDNLYSVGGFRAPSWRAPGRRSPSRPGSRTCRA
jgi:hypothetical protein